MTLVNENSNEELLKIGKPCAYHETVDPNHRIGKFLRSRMNIIDLIPCAYKLDYSKMTDESVDSSGLVPQITYEEMENYKLTCTSYGLGPSKAIRLYTTDDTSASDSVQNSLKDNFFQSGLNQISEKVSPLQEFARSFDKNLTADVVNQMASYMKPMDLGGAGNKLLATAVDIIAKGHRVSLPAIWSNSQYTPNFQAVVKLASPYGDREAVKEFIIKPLMHLLILASPRTTDGVSYGHPYNLTIKAYGLNYSPIGIISNITLRRGGNDTSFNIFRQPLSVDVSLDFQYLVNGFAHYDHTKNVEESGIFSSAANFESITDNGDAALPTVGHILTSLKPKEPENDIDYNTYYANMKPARDTKEKSTNSSSFSKSTPSNTISGFASDKVLANAAKAISDNALITENIGSIADSFQDNINPGMETFTA